MATFPPELTEPKRRRWLLGLLVAQAAFVLAVAAAGYATGAFGRTISLRTPPIDPRALLYGDHLELAYSISQVPGSFWKGSAIPRRKAPVYVVLEPREGIYEAVAVYPEEPTTTGQQVALRGWVADTWRRGMRLRYGLERYYMPADAGRKLGRRPTPLRVEISIAPWGQARITQVQALSGTRAPASPSAR